MAAAEGSKKGNEGKKSFFAILRRRSDEIGIGRRFNAGAARERNT
jgi:hypothetical protein